MRSLATAAVLASLILSFGSVPGAVPGAIDDARADVPLKATNGCASAGKNFPFLKPWVAKLDNFIAPIEIGSTEGSLFFAVGVTTVSKKAVDLWMNERVTLPIEWKRKNGSLETVWLGALPKSLPAVKPGPGSAPVVTKRDSTDASQMGARRDVRLGSKEPALKSYGQYAIGESASHADASKQDKYWTRLWEQLFAQSELDLLTACTEKSCKIKFNDPELKAIAGASHQYRLNKYRQTIMDRIEGFRRQGHIWAYEGTHKPLDWEDLPISPLFPASYNTHFWLPQSRDAYGYEIFNPEPGHHKPVIGIFSRQCEKRGQGDQTYTACSDLVLYNNHYFDFWARVVYFFPWCDVQVALAYETMDIDQIKESRVVRVLFGGEMRQLLGEVLETRLKRLHMLGF